jgi:hypothetical protein
MWWMSPALWTFLSFVTVIPFLAANVPPLTDLPNHTARYYIFLNSDKSAFLSQYYGVHWRLIGNLGVDLIVRAIGPFLGAELSAKIVAGAIPSLTVVGIYAISRSLNGQVAPSALLALPLSYNWPFDSGFVNFSLSAAMALLVLALWINLRNLRFAFRFVVFVPLSFATWVAHIAGWGLLGLGVLGFELARAYRIRGLGVRSLVDAAVATLPFALLIVFTIFWRTGKPSPIGVFYPPDVLLNKFVSLVTIFREEYRWWDAASLALFLVLTLSMFLVSQRKFVGVASLIAALYMLTFAICPDGVFGGAFVDRRILPYAFIFMPLAIGLPDQRPRSELNRKWLSLLAVAALFFFFARIAVTTAVWEQLGNSIDQHLELLQQFPRHSRVFGLMVEPCEKSWPRGRLDHVQQFAVTRRESYINGFFQEGGLNPVDAYYRREVGFDPNMAATVHNDTCPLHYLPETLQTAIAKFPRGQFEYVWLISPNPLPNFDQSGLRLIGSNGNDRLYQIERH